jgi:putative copper resistance protein D
VTLSVLTTFQQWVLFFAMTVAVGTVTWRLVVAPTAHRSLGADGAAALADVARKVASMGLLSAFALVASWILRGVVQVMGFRDPFVPLSEDVSFLLFETFWGTVWMAQGVVVVLGVVAFQQARRTVWSGSVPPSWAIAAALVVSVVATLAMSSHAMGVDAARALFVAADGVHALAAGAWIGSLAVIVTVGWPKAPTGVGAQVFASQLRGFSPIAIVCCSALVLMGVALAWTHVGTLSNLWETGYGRVLSAKVALAGLVFATGFRNWRRGLPSSDTVDGASSVRKWAAAEVSLAIGVLLLTAVLVHSAKP